ncbi:MAG: hypothetical protein HRU20_30975 [Pseudomonadales bacterium]|nr:hypothetical protein [Pseudomonadales bacterium]
MKRISCIILILLSWNLNAEENLNKYLKSLEGYWHSTAGVLDIGFKIENGDLSLWGFDCPDNKISILSKEIRMRDGIKQTSLKIKVHFKKGFECPGSKAMETKYHIPAQFDDEFSLTFIEGACIKKAWQSNWDYSVGGTIINSCSLSPP